MSDEQEISVLPVEPGFKFECLRCGKCCKKQFLSMSIDQAAYFRDVGLEIEYSVCTSTDGKIVHSIFPVPTECCGALKINEDNTTKCLIHNKRPTRCRFFPFIFRIYEKKPPTKREMANSLRLDEVQINNIRLKPYIHKLNNDRYLFVGYASGPGQCTGLGHGPAWKEKDISLLINQYLGLIEASEEQLAETSAMLKKQLMITKASDLDAHFEQIKQIFKDDTVIIGRYRITWQVPNMGDLTLEKPLRADVVLDKPMK